MDGEKRVAVMEGDTPDEAGPSRPKKEKRDTPLSGESCINDETLSIVAGRLGPDWVPLAPKLGLTLIQVKTIEQNYPKETIRQGLEMLWKWTHDQSVSVEQQKTTLRAALKKIGRADIFRESCISDSILSIIARKLGGEWVTLAIEELGFTLARVKTIEKDHPNIERRGLEMLGKWTRDQSVSVEEQITKLYTALKKRGRADIVVFMQDFPTLSIKTNLPWKETKTARATGNWDGPRRQVSAVIESCDGIIQQVNSGSVTFVVRIMSREGLNKLWRMYTTEELAKKLTDILLTEEPTTEDKSDLAIQATIPQSDYDQACRFFDELEKDQRKEFPTVSVETDASWNRTETARATGHPRTDIADSNAWEGQDYTRHQLSAVLESCDGVLEQGNPGSGTFVVRIMSQEGLDKLWRMYTTGELKNKLTEILTEEKRDLAIQTTIPENDYDQACRFFDELGKDRRKDEEESIGMTDVEHLKLGESSPATTGSSSDPAEQSEERSAEKLEILHTNTDEEDSSSILEEEQKQLRKSSTSTSGNSNDPAENSGERWTKREEILHTITEGLSSMMEVEHKQLGESSTVTTASSSDPAEHAEKRLAEKTERLHTTTAFTHTKMASSSAPNVQRPHAPKLVEKVVKTEKWGDFNCFLQGDITNTNKILVVTMHDIGHNHTAWVKFLNSKSMEHFYRRASFIHINVPGQHDKAETLPEGYNFPSLKQIAEQLPEIVRSLGVEDTRDLIGAGEGAGATIMVRFGALAGNRLLGLILLECTSGSAGFLEWAEGKFASWKLDALHKMNPSTEKYLMWHHYGGRKRSETAEEFHASLYDRLNAHNLSLFINVFQSRTDISHLLKNLQCPTLIVTGHDSPHVGEVEKVFNLLPKGNKTLLKAEDVCVDIKEKNPEKLAESIQYFIQGISGLPSLPLTRLGRAAALGETPKEQSC